MSVLLKLLIVVAVVSILRSSERFRSMSRDLDEAALDSLQKIMRASEECGYPANHPSQGRAQRASAFMAMMAGRCTTP
jgi:hypothetical protein